MAASYRDIYPPSHIYGSPLIYMALIYIAEAATVCNLLNCKLGLGTPLVRTGVARALALTLTLTLTLTGVARARGVELRNELRVTSTGSR